MPLSVRNLSLLDQFRNGFRRYLHYKVGDSLDPVTAPSRLFDLAIQQLAISDRIYPYPGDRLTFIVLDPCVLRNYQYWLRSPFCDKQRPSAVYPIAVSG